MSDLEPCADCGHRAIHLPTLGCLGGDGNCHCAVHVPPRPVVVSSPTLDRARVERDAALEQVEAAASPEWLEQAARTVVFYARQGTPFSSDDLWQAMEDRQVPRPREPRALGPVIRRALRDDVIRPDGFTQSRRRHAALIRTYLGGGSA